jgi:flavin-dependent dehydrogenase
LDTYSFNDTVEYDVAIVGGGPTGLSLSILLAKNGYRVILFEKEKYPYHRVCGEYISMESWDFLTRLGMDLSSLQLPLIRHLQVTTLNGNSIQQPLPLGGFGISRYLLDHKLAEIGRKAGVTLLENTKVNDIEFNGSRFIINNKPRGWTAGVACGSFGKRSNLDIRWKRPFVVAPKNKLNNYIGVKYHIRTQAPEDTIALHTFENGYCGLVKIEGDRHNLCYLTTAENLLKCGGNIQQMEESILSRNPYLKEIFLTGKKCSEEPVTISQISFNKKKQVENHILMTGDAAGMITPLCGNGISIALHSSKLAAGSIHLFLTGKINREEMEKQYTTQWEKQFGRRLRTGRKIQHISGNSALMNLLIKGSKLFPSFMQLLIGQTHGMPF